MKVRRKSTVVQAEQWTREHCLACKGTLPPIEGVLHDERRADCTHVVEHESPSGELGFLNVQEGDWIVADGRGLTPLRPSIFESLYESAEEGVVVETTEPLVR